MSRWQHPFALTVGLALGVALASPAVSHAQLDPNRANLSSGSGAGVSPGVNPGDSPSSTMTGRTGYVPRVGDVGSYRFPQVAPANPAEIEAIDAQLHDQALRVTEPSERALALERVARSKIFSALYSTKKLDEAHEILIMAGDAALEIPPSILKDLRLRQVVFAQMQLAEEEMRQGLAATATTLEAMPDKFVPRKFADRAPWFEKSIADYRRAAELCTHIQNVDYRSDMLYRLAESESGSNGSQAIVLTTNSAEITRRDLVGQETLLYRVADRAIVQSMHSAHKIPLNIWRDRALIAIAAAAATSEQFPRALEAAKMIPQPEFRADALVHVAEAQARKNWTNDATSTYREAATAVASIPMTDPRSTQASVLIDSLISVGRFDDARMTIVFYPDNERRMNALGAVAQSQGERNLTAAARDWINREAPEEWRPFLNRKVNDGMIAAIERRRSQSLPFGTSATGLGPGE
jgi:hypothetical protein